MDLLEDAAWRHAVGLVQTEDLPMIAAQALVDGEDSPSLRELAGLSRGSDPREISDLIARTFTDLGRTLPVGSVAERHLLRLLAAGLLAGTVSPQQMTAHACDGLDRMWGDQASATADEVAFLRLAASCGQHWEEFAPAAFQQWEDELRQAAARLAPPKPTADDDR
ncbi:hypothetical protein ACU686_31715 [Yinghuangia aomiensis]